MLTSVPIRWRLSLWYFATLAVILMVAGTGSWLAMRLSLDHALDQGLTYALTGLREYIARSGAAGAEELKAQLAPISGLSDLFRVYDTDGNLVCESTALARRHITERAPTGADSVIRFRSGGTHRFPLRMAYQRIDAGGHPITLEVAEPVRKFESAMGEFTSVLWLALPAVLILATLGGFWLSSRALRPVDQLTEDAHAITASDLSRRLAVPPTRDELRRLSETLNEMLDRIEGSFQQVRRFTADASHELRAPMTLIQTAAEFSLRRERSREEMVDGMQKILREAKRTTALVEDLLLLARADSGREEGGLHPIDLTPLLQDVADQAAALAAAKDIAVKSVPVPRPLTVSGDEASLRRLLLILVDNAIKYSPAGGKMTLEAGSVENGVRISVMDTGPGIAPEDLPHIFERFWRADKVRTRESGGTGLGLSIAKEIASRHGAALTAASEPGHGSTFTVVLPRVDA